MRLFRKVSLVVKLAARRGAFHGADGDGDGLRDPRPVGEKARTAAELQARTALRVFEEELGEQQRVNVRFGQPIGRSLHGDDLGRHALRVFAGRPRPDQRCHRRAADLLHLRGRDGSVPGP
jgi:hypothetical protein